jgi:hypothetical protein
VTFDGIDGTVQVDYGFRNRKIFVTLVFAGTVAQALARCKTALDAFNTNTRFNVALDGVNFDGCKKLAVGQPQWENMSGGVLLTVPVVFVQLSTTN